MKKKLWLVSVLLFSATAYSQVGIGVLPPNEPDRNSYLDVQATDKGILIPRVALVSITNRNPITGSATMPNSLLVFNTATTTGTDAVTPGFYYWYIDRWYRVVNANDANVISVTQPTSTGGVTNTNLQTAINNLTNVASSSGTLSSDDIEVTDTATGGAITDNIRKNTKLALKKGAVTPDKLGVPSTATAGQVPVVKEITNGAGVTEKVIVYETIKGENVTVQVPSTTSGVTTTETKTIQEVITKLITDFDPSSIPANKKGNLIVGDGVKLTDGNGGLAELTGRLLGEGNVKIEADATTIAVTQPTTGGTTNNTNVQDAITNLTTTVNNLATSQGTAKNGITKDGTDFKLGGTLTDATTTIEAAADKKLAITGLQTGATSDKIVVQGTDGVLKNIDNTANNVPLTSTTINGNNVNNVGDAITNLNNAINTLNDPANKGDLVQGDGVKLTTTDGTTLTDRLIGAGDVTVAVDNSTIKPITANIQGKKNIEPKDAETPITVDSGTSSVVSTENVKLGFDSSKLKLNDPTQTGTPSTSIQDIVNNLSQTINTKSSVTPANLSVGNGIKFKDGKNGNNVLLQATEIELDVNSMPAIPVEKISTTNPGTPGTSGTPGTNGQVLTIDASGKPIWTNLPTDKDGQKITTFEISSGKLRLGIDNGGGVKEVDLSSLTPTITTTNVLSLDTNVLKSTVNGVESTVSFDDLKAKIDTDNQKITGMKLENGTLSVTLERGNTATVNLSSLTPNVEHTLTSAGNTLTSKVGATTTPQTAPIINSNTLTIADGKLKSTINEATDKVGEVALGNLLPKASETSAVVVTDGDAKLLGGNATIDVKADNGLSIGKIGTGTQGHIKLGGTLKEATKIETSTDNTLAITGLETRTGAIGAVTNTSGLHHVVMEKSTGVLKSKKYRKQQFYLPSMVLPVTEGTHSIDLHSEYKKQYVDGNATQNGGASVIKSAGTSVDLETFTANELDYFVTYYDRNVFESISITAAGVLTYTVKANAEVTEHTFMNIVLQEK